MRLGLCVRNTGPAAVDSVRLLPAEAERWGYDSVWFTDHVVGVRSMDSMYGPVWVEILTCLAHAAATTSSIRLGTSILVLPYRDPVFAAKALTTIDQLSGGRLNVGVGVGALRSEFAALGRHDLFEVRGAVSDEYLDVMLRCWQGGEFGWEGEYVSFRRLEFFPVPAQHPHPPLYIGGHSPAALRRVLRVGDIWHPALIRPAEVARLGAELDERAGRAIPRTVRIVEWPSTDIAALLGEYAGAGCDEVVVDIRTDDIEETRARAVEIIESRPVSVT